MITYSQLKKNISEKIFDGKFYKKSTQDEALEVLQQFDKIVDSRKVREDRLALREGVYVLIKRPMTAIGEGYLVGIIIKGIEKEFGDAEAKIIKSYGGNDFRVGSTISISYVDVMAVSEDNKRFYIVYPIPTETETYRDPDPDPDPDPKADKKDNGGDTDADKQMGMLKKMALS